MNSVKFTAINGPKTTQQSLALRTDPPISQEVIDLLKSWQIEGAKLTVDWDGEHVLLNGPAVFPPRAHHIPELEKSLSDAFDRIAMDNRMALENHISVVNQFSTQHNLPVEM